MPDNTEYKAEFPEIVVTVKDSEGHILATDSQMGFYIMPEDTITLVGMISVQKEMFTDDIVVSFDVKCGELVSVNLSDNPNTSDFEIGNIFEQSGKNDSRITGEIVNNYSENVDQINLSLVLRKEGEIVYVENIFVEGLTKGTPIAFQFNSFSEWPEHDAIEISAQEW